MSADWTSAVIDVAQSVAIILLALTILRMKLSGRKPPE